MLVAQLDNALRHDYLSERFRKAYAFLNRDDLRALPVGRVDIDGAAACGMKGYCFADGNVEKLQKALESLNKDS